MDGKTNNHKSGLGLKSALSLSAGVGAMLVGFASGAAWAQDADEEEGTLRQNAIVITALKRETTLQDTPVAVSVVGGDDIQASSIRDIRDLQLLAPSLGVGQAATSSQQVISIRGLGTSGFNFGLEPSVGIFVDGVYRSRPGAILGDFPTVERIEVLRGPQSTLYGRNTSAGVVSIITKKPSFEPGFEVEGTLGNFGTRILKGTATAPIGEGAAVRISGNVNRRDGFIDNVTTGRSVNDRDRWSLRGQFLYEAPDSDFSVRLIADTSTIGEECCAGLPFLHAPGNFAAMTFLGANLQTGSPFDRVGAFNGDINTEQEAYGFSGEVNWGGLGWADFTSITAYRSFDETNDLDADFTDLPLSKINQNIEAYTTFTQEFRLTSTGDGPFGWMGGVFYYDQDLTHNRISTFGPTLRSFADLASGNAVTTLEQILGAFRGVAPGTFLGDGTGLTSERFEQGDQAFAIFANADYELTPQLTVSGGLRWAQEEKDVVSNVTLNAPFSALDLQNIPELAFLNIPVNAFAGLSAFQFFPPFENFSDDDVDSNISGSLRLEYEVSDNLNVYGSYNTGWKAGGFNLSVATSVSEPGFDAEDAASFEIGAKGQLFDGAMTVNAALFDQTIEDFQTNIFNGTNFTLANAGEISSKGFEIDTIVTPSEHFVFTAAATYLDDKYESFERGPCLNPAFLASVPNPQDFARCNPLDPTIPAELRGTNDLSGQDIVTTPEWSANATATFLLPMGEYNSFFRGEMQYRSETSTSSDGTPEKAQDGYTLFNASVGVTFPDDTMDVVFWGKNLTDEEFAQGIFDTVAQPGSLSGYPNDPPTYGITLRVRR